jgi:hypothetical protein
MKKALFWVVGIALAIQLIRPDFTSASVDEATTLRADTPTMNLIKNSCYDCHSNETKYPWYRNIAPISWVMADHISQGRKSLNFSNWEKIDPKIKLERLKRAKETINNQLMPKSEYLMFHEDAVLSSDEKQLLASFFDSEIEKLNIKEPFKH